MNCLKCGQPLLNSGLKCWGCRMQHQITETPNSAKVIQYESNPPTNADYYYPEHEYIQWEY